MPENQQEQPEAQLLLNTIVKTPDNFLASLLGILDFDDFYNTSFRLWEIFSNILANPANRIQGDEVDPEDYPGSSFTQFFHDSTIAISEYFTGCVFFSSLSLIRQLYRCYQQRQSNSYRFLQVSLGNMGIKENDKLASSIDEIQISLGKLLLDINPYYQVDTSQKSTIKLKPNTTILRAPPKRKILEKLANKPNHIEHFFALINNLRKTSFGAFCRVLWINLRANTFIFWAIWMPFNIIVGTAALATTGIFAPIILSISLGIMAIYSIWKAYKAVNKAIKVKHKSPVDLQQEAKAAKGKNASKKEKRYVIHNLKQRFLIEKYHQYQRQKTNITYTQIIHQLDIINKSLNLNITETIPNHAASATASTSTQAPVLSVSQASKTVSYAAEAIEIKQKLQPSFKVISTNKRQVPVKNLSSQYLEHKTFEPWARLIIHTFLQGIAGFTGSAFILWFVSYLLGTLASAFAFLGSVASFLGGPVVLIGIGVTLGLVFAIKGAAKIWQEQKKFQEMVAIQLTQQHVSYNHSKKVYELTGKSKLHVLTEKEQKIIDIKNRINILREKIKCKVGIYNHSLEAKNDGNVRQKLDEDNFLIKNDELETINVIAQPLKEQSSQRFIWFKKFLNRAYELVAGQQTGVYLTRIIFLSTGIAGSAIAGLLNPALAFLIIAGVLSLVVGLPRLARYQLDRNQENRKNLINNLDTQIAHLDNAINGLTELEAKLINIDNQLNTIIQSTENITKNIQLKTPSSNHSRQIQTSNLEEKTKGVQAIEIKQPQHKFKAKSYGNSIKQKLIMFFRNGANNVYNEQNCTQAAFVDNCESFSPVPKNLIIS